MVILRKMVGQGRTISFSKPGCFPALAVLLIAFPCFAAESTDVQRGYSTAPLKKAVFETAQVILSTTAINNWLVENYAELSYEEAQRPRENLYALIDSWAKHSFAGKGVILPREPDPILAILTSWAEPLGVYGGAQIHNAVKSPSSPTLATRLHPPSSLALTLDGDLFHVRSLTGGWSFSVPYYFMIWSLGDFDAPNGLRTQEVALSTGFAQHDGQLGYSQATLMVLFSPGAGEKVFADFWMQQLGIDTAGEELDLGVRGLSSHKSYDESQNMHKEFTSWTSPEGPFGVAYSGLNGTYQWNRVHFLDLLRNFETK